ncbi:exportin-2 [Olea europaea subsp. europaea]|uniref:Exportin-2 n=1 Tax=Olea europaea subsp. europaea TaxID=158383 RepID=A0A8S0VPN0_OLEEU|nr:exportin-2 [Olea europaea subsp. europaea]
MFGMVIEKLYLADVKKVTGPLERKICICGLIKIISQLPLIENGSYNHLWAPLLLVLMEMFELPQDIPQEDDDHFADITESLDFQAQYSKLNYATRPRADPTKDIGDMKAMLAASLASLSTKLPGFVPKAIQENLDQGVVTCLMNYCRAANVTIA